jgi:endonuclease/exonuclease/phosphatase family metal-dependent hydrolase
MFPGFILLQELSQANYNWFKSKVNNYEILRAFNREVGVESELALAYRKNFTLKESKFYSFFKFLKWNFKRAEMGLLAGRFQVPAGEVIITSVHLNPALSFIVRRDEAKFIKKCLLDFNIDSLPVIFGGDFNSGLPEEKARNNRIFAPEFINLTDNSGATVDSRYVEPGPGLLLNNISVFLAKFGFHLRMKVDHIYADQETAKNDFSFCKVFPDRVSDHSAMEVILLPKK